MLLKVGRNVEGWEKVFVSELTVKLSDFGLSRRFDLERDTNNESQTLTAVGTPAFEAPEILKAAADRDCHARATSSADIWSAGVLTYKLTTQKLPGNNDTATVSRFIN